MSNTPTPATEPSAKTGHEVIEAALKRAINADPADAPFPLDHDQAAIWHQASASAYQHALEMIPTPAAAVGGGSVKCEKCFGTGRVIVGPRSFGEVTTVPCPECNLYRDDYISGAELESRLDTLVEEYEWDDGESRHVPTETERLLLIDFAHGILADELFCAMLKAHYDPNSRNRPTPPAGGFVVVPREPTEAMLCAGFPEAGFEYTERYVMRDVWEAMVKSAAPDTLKPAEELRHDFSDNLGRNCIVCGASEWYTGTTCPGPNANPTAQPSAKDGVRGEGAVAWISPEALEVLRGSQQQGRKSWVEVSNDRGEDWHRRQPLCLATTASGLVDGDEVLAALSAHVQQFDSQKDFAQNGVHASEQYVSDVLRGKVAIPEKWVAALGYVKSWVYVGTHTALEAAIGREVGE